MREQQDRWHQNPAPEATCRFLRAGREGDSRDPVQIAYQLHPAEAGARLFPAVPLVQFGLGHCKIRA